MPILLPLYFIIQIVIKAFLYRARGSHHDTIGTTEARILFWGIPWGLDGTLIAYLNGCSSTGTLMILYLMLTLSGWLACTLRHGAWQSPTRHNYLVMGLITTGMLTIMLMPLIFFDLSMVKYIPLGMLGWPACIIGYSPYFQRRSLNFLGITCNPGTSEWEEFWIGALPFGTTIAIMGLIGAGII